ncbi:hypothetical protein UP06_18980 [Bradyrhizobium sp. LTSP857]|nr:hypothetical protein UP06_18980 [Bradyrhizobium sp. LTSP857]
MPDSDHAYDEHRLRQLSERDLYDASRFETELKDTFGFGWVDDEVREPLEDAINQFISMSEQGDATPAGIFATALKVFLKAHPRGFGRYYSGHDPWPRSPELIRAEIDARMPIALSWLQDELDEALERASFKGSDDRPYEEKPFDNEATTMLRMRSEKPDPTDGMIVVAANRARHTGDPAIISRERLNHWWADCCARFSRPDVDWCKAGAVMWDHVQIEVPPDWIAFMMSLKSVDADLARATMAGLFGAVATTVGPVDMDSIMHGITTFVHTHPAFSAITKEGEWHLPYGENTAYSVLVAPGQDENQS